jgi:hypothetical protein
MPDRKTNISTRRLMNRFGPGRFAAIPMEWMGPPVWRLPSGKALAEFALQAGFLAPPLLGDGPIWRGPSGASKADIDTRHTAVRNGQGGLNS